MQRLAAAMLPCCRRSAAALPATGQQVQSRGMPPCQPRRSSLISILSLPSQLLALPAASHSCVSGLTAWQLQLCCAISASSSRRGLASPGKG